jgi:CspA family cold shock protein
MATKEGTLKWFNEVTGYGLIRPDDGGRALLVSGRDLELDGFAPIEEGAAVSYEVNSRSGLRAFNVSLRGHYSWRDDCLPRHEGKEARNEYYAGLEGRAPLG